MSPTTPHDPKPDALRSIYLDAVAEDRGPDVASSERILAYARQQAKARQRSAYADTDTDTATDTAQRGPADQEKPAAFDAPTQPAANDRQWRRHALGGIATLGLVGWLMLQQSAWWDDGSHYAPPAPPTETVSLSDSMPADMAASTAPAAAPPAPMPPRRQAASMQRYDSLPDAKTRTIERPAPAPESASASASAETMAKARPLPQERQAAGATTSEPKSAPLPWCPDGAANTAADAQVFSKESETLSATSTPPTCRPRSLNQQLQPQNKPAPSHTAQPWEPASR